MTAAKTTTAKTPAKKPQDRKPKATDAPPVITVTVDDFTVTFDAERMDDYELMEDIARVEDGEYVRIGKVLSRWFGEEKHAEIKERFRDPETKRVPLEPIIAFFGELMAATQAEVDARG